MIAPRLLDEENRNMKSKLRDSQGITLVVVLMVMAILLSVVGAGLLFSGINMKISGNYQTGARAFYAADIGINASPSPNAGTSPRQQQFL